MMSTQTISPKLEDVPPPAEPIPNPIPVVAERAQFALFLLLCVENDFVNFGGVPGNRTVNFEDQDTKNAITTAVQPMVANPGNDPAADIETFLNGYANTIQTGSFPTELNGDRVNIPYSEALLAVRDLYQQMSVVPAAEGETFTYPDGKICHVLSNITGIVRPD